VSHTLGRAASALDRPATAEEHYREAAELYERIGDTEQAARERETAAGTREAAERDVDAELRRLHAALDAQPAPAMRRVTLVVELAELHVRNGNDLDAKRWLTQAQHALTELGHADPLGPTGTRLAEALTGFVTAGAGDLGELLAVRDLYGRIYSAWHRIRRSEGDIEGALRYSALAAGLANKATGDEFSQRMRAALPEIFGDT
jgi:tetratricopeptide (TPR) repeat protein